MSPASTSVSVLDELPSLQRGQYRVDPYIVVAIHFQSIGREAAYQELSALAASCDFEKAQKALILCHMLYSPRNGASFKPVYIGLPGFYRDEEDSLLSLKLGSARGYKVWKTAPIEIVSGIPFAVVTGYAHQGLGIQAV